MILAFAKIREAFPEAVLVIAGSPWKDNFCRYEKQIKAYGICEAVKRDIRYIPDEDVKSYYSAGDINVLPYLDGYQSGVMQLAFAYERPVLVTDLPAFTSVISDGKNGLICRTGSVSSLAVTMKRAILCSREELDRMGRRGRQDMERFSWDKIAWMVEEEYRTGPKRRREQVW